MPKEPIHRIYSFSDSALIQWMRKMVAILQLYLTDFGTYDPMFDVAYATALETETDDAEAIPDDPTCPHRKRWGK